MVVFECENGSQQKKSGCHPHPPPFPIPWPHRAQRGSGACSPTLAHARHTLTYICTEWLFAPRAAVLLPFDVARMGGR